MPVLHACRLVVRLAEVAVSRENSHARIDPRIGIAMLIFFRVWRISFSTQFAGNTWQLKYQTSGFQRSMKHLFSPFEVEFLLIRRDSVSVNDNIVD
jgi:hypothetical protein